MMIFIGCNSTDKTSVLESEKSIIIEKQLHTYVVECNGKVDTIVAQNYMAGNYVGYGKAIVFYINMENVGTILIPKNRELSIKTIQ